MLPLNCSNLDFFGFKGFKKIGFHTVDTYINMIVVSITE
jgi:hypothetical protein